MNHKADRHAEEGVDVVIRFHDPRRIWELERAAFSLAGQEHRPIRMLVVCQRFSEAAQDAVRQAIGRTIGWAPGVTYDVLNFTDPEPADARSMLANLGFTQLSGRYLGLLDYDDVLYPEAYRLLVGRLRQGDAAIAFARTPVVHTDVHDGFLHARARSTPHLGYGIIDLFTANFCPLHSYLIDRWRVPAALLRFEPQLTIEEDYAFLLGICAQFPSDFRLIGTDVGLYIFKNDNSNTFCRSAPPPPATMARIAAASAYIAGLRGILPVAPGVQRLLGIHPARPGLTISDCLGLKTRGAA